MDVLKLLEDMEPTRLVVVYCGMTTTEEFNWFREHGSTCMVRSLPHTLCCFVFHEPFLGCQLGERKGEIKLGVALAGNQQEVLELTPDAIKGILRWNSEKKDYWRGIFQRMGWT